MESEAAQVPDEGHAAAGPQDAPELRARRGPPRTSGRPGRRSRGPRTPSGRPVASARPSTLWKRPLGGSSASATAAIARLGSTPYTTFPFSTNIRERSPVPEPTSAITCSGTRPRSERRVSSTCGRVAGPPADVVLDAVGEARRRVEVAGCAHADAGACRAYRGGAGSRPHGAGSSLLAMSAAPVPAGPRGAPLLGHLLAFRRDPLGFLLRTARDYPGEVVQLPPGPARRSTSSSTPTSSRKCSSRGSTTSPRAAASSGRSSSWARACSRARASSTRASGGWPSPRSTGSASARTARTWCGARVRDPRAAGPRARSSTSTSR